MLNNKQLKLINGKNYINMLAFYTSDEGNSNYNSKDNAKKK